MSPRKRLSKPTFDSCLVAKKLTLKFSPELRFRLDETFDRMDDTRRMFDQAAVRRDLDQ